MDLVQENLDLMPKSEKPTDLADVLINGMDAMLASGSTMEPVPNRQTLPTSILPPLNPPSVVQFLAEQEAAERLLSKQLSDLERATTAGAVLTEEERHTRFHLEGGVDAPPLPQPATVTSGVPTPLFFGSLEAQEGLAAQGLEADFIRPPSLTPSGELSETVKARLKAALTAGTVPGKPPSISEQDLFKRFKELTPGLGVGSFTGALEPVCRFISAVLLAGLLSPSAQNVDPRIRAGAVLGAAGCAVAISRGT